MHPLKTRTAARKTQYLVLWWMSQTPFAALFDTSFAAEAAASVRNGIVVTISGEHVRVEEVDDWYRRDDTGRPMPAEWRDLAVKMRLPEFREPTAADVAA